MLLLHNLGLGTKYVFLHVGWVQNLNLFSEVFLLVSTRATWDSGIKILVLHTSGFEFRFCTLPFRGLMHVGIQYDHKIV